MSWAKIVALGIALSVGLPLALGSTDYWKWGDDPANDVLKGSVNVMKLCIGIAEENPAKIREAFSGTGTEASMPDVDLVLARTQRYGDMVQIEWKLSGPAQEDKRHAYILAARVGKLLMIPKGFVLVSLNGKMIYRNDMTWKPPPLPSKADSYVDGQSFVLRIPESTISADEWDTVVVAVVKLDEDKELVSPEFGTFKGYFDYVQLEETSMVIPEGSVAIVLSVLLCIRGRTWLARTPLSRG